MKKFYFVACCVFVLASINFTNGLARSSPVAVKELCQRSRQGMPVGFNIVNKCGDLYRVDNNLPDVPYDLVDQNGKRIVSCGGMPGPNQSEESRFPKPCRIKCDEKNLCVK